MQDNPEPGALSPDFFPKGFERAQALDNEAKELGFYWLFTEQILAQISSETQEIRQALEQKESLERVTEEIGDLLHSVIGLCYFLDLSPEAILESSLNKFEKRFRIVKELMAAQGLKTLKGKTHEALALWEEVKKAGAAGED